MGILDELLAGGQRQKEYGDFVKRYEQGDPSEGYSDQEVLKRYGEVSLPRTRGNLDASSTSVLTP